MSWSTQLSLKLKVQIKADRTLNQWLSQPWSSAPTSPILHLLHQLRILHLLGRSLHGRPGHFSMDVWKQLLNNRLNNLERCGMIEKGKFLPFLVWVKDEFTRFSYSLPWSKSTCPFSFCRLTQCCLPNVGFNMRLNWDFHCVFLQFLLHLPVQCAQEMLLHRTNQDEDKVPTIFQIRSEIFLGFHPRTDINNTQWHILHKQNLKKCSDADAGLVLLFSASAFARNQGWNLKRLKNSADAAQARAGFSWTCFLHQLRRSTKVFLCKAQAYNEDCAKADKNHKKLNVYYLQVDFFWSSIKEGIWTTFGAVATQVEL